jgi:hypothetical protein
MASSAPRQVGLYIADASASVRGRNKGQVPDRLEAITMLRKSLVAIAGFVTLALLAGMMPSTVTSAQELTGKQKKPVGLQWKLRPAFVTSYSTSAAVPGRSKPRVLPRRGARPR